MTLENDNPFSAVETKDKKKFRGIQYRRMAEGALLGAMLSWGINLLGINTLLKYPVDFDIMIVPSLLGALLGVTRLRLLLRIASALTVFAILIVGYTPLASYLMNGLSRRDTLAPAPAIVILSSSRHKDGSLSSTAQSRAIQGYFLLRQSYSNTLILTQDASHNGPEAPTVRQQMGILGIQCTILETGPVLDTHDEAVAVAKICRLKNWRKIILVTHPWHMRRAEAVFSKAGMNVICSPCVESEYDLSSLNSPLSRLRAFRDWLHEIVGYKVYQWRGWI